MTLRVLRKLVKLAEIATCRHCGDEGPAGEDHTCSYPLSDEACREHPER